MNGWSNYETWNVVLWLQNEETLWHEYRAAARPFVRAGMLKDDNTYCVRVAFVRTCGAAKTPDGVDLYDSNINWREIYEAALDWFDLDEDVDAESLYEEWERKDSFGKELY